MNNKTNMKTKIVSLFLAVVFSLGIQAQVDRSKQPEPGPAPKISIDKPQEFELKNGLKVLLVENHKLPRVSYSLRIDNKPTVEGDKSGVSSILSAMLGNGTTTISKDDFNEEVDFLGANISFGSSSAFASCLSKYSDRILELMADAAMNPLLTEEEFQKEKDKLIEGLKTNEKSVSAAAGRVSSALSYGASHPSGEFTTEETVNNITMPDVLAYYETHFNPKNSYLVVIGDIDRNTLEASVEKNFGSWTNSASVDTDIVEPMPNAQYTQINFVDMPNAVQSNIIVTNNVDLKMGDDDYHAALVANNILGGGATGYLFQNLRDDKAYTYGSYSSIGASRFGASRFSATAEVRNEVTDSSVVEMLKEIDRIRTENVAPETLERAKASYLGNFVMALERPQTVANFAMNIKLNDLPSDYYENYLTKINAVTADDVKRAANKYFQRDNTRIIVVGKGSDVIENLEKTGIPVKYYDKYAKAVEKPNYDVEMPSDVTAKSVLQGYLKATGLTDNLGNIKSIMTQYEATTPMGDVTAEEKRVDGKTVQNLYVGGNKMMGMIMTKDGASANNQPLPGNMTNDLKANAGLFMEINLIDSDAVKLKGIEKVEDKDAYVIEVPGEVISFTLYYDVESGLKVKEIQQTSMQGQTQSQEALLKDYKDYNGLKFPGTRDATMMGQSVVFKLKEVKINEGVSEADFGN